ncbi:MAG: translation initiation factor 2 [Ruminococcaceae bacterium]|nr:translation initiation factor 2 [Oscillospiraceae bacterium]
MVKGVSKQVVVVKPPQGIFEEAIFILKEDTVGVDAEQVVSQARAVANEYVSEQCEWKQMRNHAPLWFSVGALCASFLWLMCILI